MKITGLFKCMFPYGYFFMCFGGCWLSLSFFISMFDFCFYFGCFVVAGLSYFGY